MASKFSEYLEVIDRGKLERKITKDPIMREVKQKIKADGTLTKNKYQQDIKQIGKKQVDIIYNKKLGNFKIEGSKNEIINAEDVQKIKLEKGVNFSITTDQDNPVENACFLYCAKNMNDINRAIEQVDDDIKSLQNYLKELNKIKKFVIRSKILK